jgi:hypothetical protein
MSMRSGLHATRLQAVQEWLVMELTGLTREDMKNCGTRIFLGRPEPIQSPFEQSHCNLTDFPIHAHQQGLKLSAKGSNSAVIDRGGDLLTMKH